MKRSSVLLRKGIAKFPTVKVQYRLATAEFSCEQLGEGIAKLSLVEVL